MTPENNNRIFLKEGIKVRSRSSHDVFLIVSVEIDEEELASIRFLKQGGTHIYHSLTSTPWVWSKNFELLE